MALTRPTADQLVFRSSTHGALNLDTYLEAAERGGRQLGDLLGDLFDTSGNFATDAFQFRLNTTSRELQVRVGTYTDPEASWSNLGPIFRPKGLRTDGVAYSVMDVVGDGTDLYLVTEDIGATELVGNAVFTASSKTFRILTGDSVAAASQYATTASNAATQSGLNVTSAQQARDLAEAYASGTPTNGTLSALAYRDQAEGFRNEIFNSPEFTAVSDDLALDSSTSVLKQIETDLTDITTLVSGIVSGSSPQRTNLTDVLAVAANLNNITAVAGLNSQMASVIAFEADISSVGNSIQSVVSVGGALTEISTIHTDLNLGSLSEIRRFNDGLSATIDNLTINGVARGGVYQNTAALATFDMSQANNFFLDMTNHAAVADANNNVNIVFINADQCNNMQPFTISIKQDAAFNNTTTSPAPNLVLAGTNLSFKNPNATAPNFTTNGNDIITISGYVLDPSPTSTTIVLGHMVNA